MDIICKTNNLCKSYGKRVLSNVNMTINRGDIYGFVGENGAGKTTLIRIIAGLVKEDSGSFSLFGDEDIYSSRQKIRAVVEAPSLYTSFSAYDNMAIMCRLLDIKDYEQISEMLSIVGLKEFIKSKKKVKDFSLGMKQRLGIAMSMLGNPEFIILDEPMNGLDPEAIVSLRNLIKMLNEKKGITFLISSHLLPELQKVANKIGFIHRGVLVEEKTVAEIEEISIIKNQILVDDASLLPEIMAELEIENYEITNNSILTFGEINLNDVLGKIISKNVKICAVNTMSDDIEQYYLSLMGGKRNEKNF